MKPDEEMHAAVEEVDLDPCDLYVDLGTLIVEGRVPGITEKGFGEGPHCHSHHGQNRHQCDPSSPECQKYEQIEKHMLLLWKNGIPMSIEVLLYPPCCTPSQNIDAVPEISYILLEQWTIHMLPKRVPDASISPKGLIQAVRSFLYFSQLCAWLSLTKGKSPRNVHYRVCVPGEAFSSKFSIQPDCHIFPIANIGRSSSMKVVMKCHPRCGEIPTVPCLKHSQPMLPLKSRTTQEAERELQASGEYVYDGILPSGASSSRTGSPADSMLGESLLDPPNSLCMYPKRYQSPSRCGSPSIEAPEHLMFRKPVVDTSTQRRSRPQRRPVVERFLQKALGEEQKPSAYSDIRCRAYDKRPVVSNESLYYCLDERMKELPKREMEEVLERLRERQQGVKVYNSEIPSVHSPDNKAHHMSAYFEELKLTDSKPETNPKRPSKQTGEPGCTRRDTKCKSHMQYLSSLPEVHNSRFDVESKNHHILGIKNCNQTSRYVEHELNENNLIHAMKENKRACAIQNNTQKLGLHPSTYHREIENNNNNEVKIPPKSSTVNIKKYGELLSAKTDVVCDEREILTSPDGDFVDDVGFYSPTIPSAEKKALFRRSLDSATSLVFHQKSGLPLTSSPAPIRKSGTCFDFDSSLTSVSAIKRALFEKEPEEEKAEQQKVIHLSISAPASIISSSLLGTFEESVLNGRLEPVSTVEGFLAEIGASGSFCPKHITLPVTVFFYTLQDMDKVTSPYMGHINLRNKDYHVPKKGTVQVTLFNPHRTVVKMFVVRYDLSDMPVNCQTFLRQRTLYMPSEASESDTDAQKWLRYLIHLRFMSSKSGRIYLHTDIRVIIFRKSDLDAATVHGQRPYELRSFTHGPTNPKFSPHKP